MKRPLLYIYSPSPEAITYAIQYPDGTVEYFYGKALEWRLSAWTGVKTVLSKWDGFELVGQL